MDLANQDPTVVTVWSDVSCPWATLALHTLHEAAGQQALQIDHRAFPLELVNRQPTPKQGHDIEVATIVAVRPQLGWRPWSSPDSTYPVTALPALEAVQAAKQLGGFHASDQLDTALRRSFFVEHRCISLHTEILEIAETCPDVDAEALKDLMSRGAGRREVYEDWQMATDQEVPGSPSLYTADSLFASNPGVDLDWVEGFPRINAYDAEWPTKLLDAIG